MSLLVGNDRERSNFRTRTCRRRNSYKVSLFSHLRESVNSLTYIHKSHSEILEIYFGVLIKDPHYLTCVHCGSAADSYDNVRLEFFHCLCTFHCAAKRRVGSNVEERRMSYAHLVQSVGDSLCKTALIQEAVSYDKCLLLAHYFFEFSQSHAETTLFEIYLFRCSEPQHILSPFRYCLDIDKVLDLRFHLRCYRPSFRNRA